MNNDTDGIELKDHYGNQIDSVEYRSKWGGKSGYSLERKFSLFESNDSSNWTSSTDIELSTPGRQNSITPKNFDLKISSIKTIPRFPAMDEEVIVSVYDRPMKNLLFSIEERLEMVRQALAYLANVQVESYSGLTAKFARDMDAPVIVRGLRALSDFEWELQLSLANHSLDPHIETVCLMASQEHSFLSSSILKEVALNNGSIEHLAPPVVVSALYEKARFDENGDSPIRTVSVRD